MSNQSLKRVFQKLLSLKGKNEKPGYILCLVNKETEEPLEEEQITKGISAKSLNESYKKPLFAAGSRKRKRVVTNDLEPDQLELEIELRQKEIQEKTRERYFASLATKGVIQLFNAISAHQKEINKKLTEVGKSETKKEKIISSTSKGSFIQRLNNKSGKKTFKIEATL